MGLSPLQALNPFSGFNLSQWFADRINEAFLTISGSLHSLADLMTSTSLAYTTQNAIILTGWRTMTTASDILLGLIIIVGAIQMMYADSIGTLRMTIGQFIGRALLTAILIHLSGFIGEELLILNNLLCGVVTINITDFILQINHGKLFTANQQLIVMGALGIVFLIGFFRVLFQTIKRLIRFNVLFVLSGPAFLTSFHPATSPIFSIWSRMYVMTIFEQFLQVLTFGLGFQFLISVKQTGLPGFIMAVALMNMTAEVPALLARFGAAPGGQGGSSFGSLVGTGIKVAAVLAA